VLKTNYDRVYDGALMCGTAGCGCGCPVVDRADDGNLVIWDPAKPENGKFILTVEEFNLLLQNAKPIP
jgi:hypothetical protein